MRPGAAAPGEAVEALAGEDADDVHRHAGRDRLDPRALAGLRRQVALGEGDGRLGTRVPGHRQRAVDAAGAQRPVGAVDDEHHVDVGGQHLLGVGAAGRPPRDPGAAGEDRRDAVAPQRDPVAGGQAGTAHAGRAGGRQGQPAAPVDAADPRRDGVRQEEMGELGVASLVPAERRERRAG